MEKPVTNGRATVMVVEDNAATRRLIEEILKEEYRVLTAASGPEAIETLAAHEDAVDLVLLDIIMPGMSGYEVCEHLKARPATRDIPIIFLTIMEGDIDEAKGFAAGVNDYIIKPVNRLRLRARVRNQLLIQAHQRELARKNAALQEALEHLKVLKGILPICSYCKQIRNDKGYWQQVEEYVSSHSAAEFSHSICPACLKKHFPDIEPPTGD